MTKTPLNLPGAKRTCEFVPHSVDDLNGFLVERLRLDQAVSDCKQQSQRRRAASATTRLLPPQGEKWTKVLPCNSGVITPDCLRGKVRVRVMV